MKEVNVLWAFLEAAFAVCMNSSPSLFHKIESFVDLNQFIQKFGLVDLVYCFLSRVTDDKWFILNELETGVQFYIPFLYVRKWLLTVMTIFFVVKLPY
jgi:hypothetical protein